MNHKDTLGDSTVACIRLSEFELAALKVQAQRNGISVEELAAGLVVRGVREFSDRGFEALFGADGVPV